AVRHAPRGMVLPGSQQTRVAAGVPPASPVAEKAAEAKSSPELFAWVRDGEGNPLAGATVAIVLGHEGVPGAAVTTDDEGYYELAHAAENGLVGSSTGEGLLSIVYSGGGSLHPASGGLAVAGGASFTAKPDPIAVDRARLVEEE